MKLQSKEVETAASPETDEMRIKAMIAIQVIAQAIPTLKSRTQRTPSDVETPFPPLNNSQTG